MKMRSACVRIVFYLGWCAAIMLLFLCVCVYVYVCVRVFVCVNVCECVCSCVFVCLLLIQAASDSGGVEPSVAFGGNKRFGRVFCFPFFCSFRRFLLLFVFSPVASFQLRFPLAFAPTVINHVHYSILLCSAWHVFYSVILFTIFFVVGLSVSRPSCFTSSTNTVSKEAFGGEGWAISLLAIVYVELGGRTNVRLIAWMEDLGGG